MLELDRIICGDCLEVMKKLPGRCIDMILCDLPYGTTACKWDHVIPFEPLWKEYKRLIKDRGAIVLTASQPFTSALVMSNTRMFKYCWIWAKPQGTDPFMSDIRPMNNYEDVCIFSSGTTLYNPQNAPGKPYTVARDRRKSRLLETTGTAMKSTKTVNHGSRCPTRILNFDQERGNHPTQKPVALFEYLIKTYTNEGDLVLDNCIGSGTTAVAAKRTGRHFIGIELSEEYCEIARKRVAAVPRRLDSFFQQHPEEDARPC